MARQGDPGTERRGRRRACERTTGRRHVRELGDPVDDAPGGRTGVVVADEPVPQPRGVRLGQLRVRAFEDVEGPDEPRRQQHVVAEALVDAEVGDEDRPDPGAHRLEPRRRGHGEDHVHRPQQLRERLVHELEVRRQVVAREQLGGMVAGGPERVLVGPVPRLDQHPALRVPAGVLDEPPVQVRAVRARRRNGRLVGEQDRTDGTASGRGWTPGQQGQAREHEVVGRQPELGAGRPERPQVLARVHRDDVRREALEVPGDELLDDHPDPARHHHRPDPVPAPVGVPGVGRDVLHEPRRERPLEREHEHVGAGRAPDQLGPRRPLQPHPELALELGRDEAPHVRRRRVPAVPTPRGQLRADAGRPPQLRVVGHQHQGRGRRVRHCALLHVRCSVLACRDTPRRNPMPHATCMTTSTTGSRILTARGSRRPACALAVRTTSA